MEAFLVNVDKPEAILKKLTRQTKKSLKRTHSEAMPESEGDKVDKTEIEEKIKAKEYEFTLHFSKSSVWVIDIQNKARSFAILPGKNFDCIVASHNNRCVHYELSLESNEGLK
jgi:hypothetical protein